MLLIASVLVFGSSCARKSVPLAHYPVQNPQGASFEADPEFVRAYQRHLAISSIERKKREAIENSTSRSAIRLYEIDDITKLKQVDPKDAGWNQKYIPPPESKAKSFITGLFSSKNEEIAKDDDLIEKKDSKHAEIKAASKPKIDLEESPGVPPLKPTAKKAPKDELKKELEEERLKKNPFWKTRKSKTVSDLESEDEMIFDESMDELSKELLGLNEESKEETHPTKKKGIFG